MKTGDGKEFPVDAKRTAAAERALRQRKGLIRGDPRRIPKDRKGLRPVMSGEEIPELIPFSGDPEEDERARTFIAGGPLELEIGFAGGEMLLHRARKYPQRRFLGIEIRRSFCRELARRIMEYGLSNIRVCLDDARAAVPELIPPGRIERCYVLFPDPWWKRRHMHRRIISPWFLDLMAELLAPEGLIEVKTDVLPYADLVQETFDKDDRFRFAEPEEYTDLEDNPPSGREAYCLRKSRPFRTFRVKMAR